MSLVDEKVSLPYALKGDGSVSVRPTTDNRKRRFRRFLTFTVLILGAHYVWNGFGFRSQAGSELNGHPPKHHPPHRGHRFVPPKLAEKLFLKVPNAESAMEASRHYAGQPHLAGSEADYEQARDFLSFLQSSLGISPPKDEPVFSAGSPDSRHATLSIPHLRHPKAWIDVYYPIMNTPLDRALQAFDGDGNVIWEADLEENADDTDPDAGKYTNAVPSFHGLSAAGDVKGQLIYANYGSREDYDTLVEKGVDFKNRIVLVRYGGIFRGLKIKGAEELGAAGVLIYSDPRDDGTVTEENGYKPFPEGPARNVKAVQRGSVQYLSLYPGDPTTPGIPAYENATRTSGENIPKIPSLPISWENAKKLIDLLDSDWDGVVRLANNVDTKVTPIWNTIGVIPGFIKDEIVVVGNHRDAWVLGAADPTSGTSSLHEAIRGFGELLKKGWRPSRTIVFASWDAEEYGLIGSTEYGEDFADFISKHVVAYLNLDVSVAGSRFSAQASPLLAHVVRNAAEDLPHPTKENATLWDATQDEGEHFGLTAQKFDEESELARELMAGVADDLGVGALGSGSDFTVFLQRLGVPSINHGFGAGKHDPVYHYHSIYDSELFQEKFADPGFHRHVAIAKHLGLITLRVSSPPVLPLNTTHYALELDNYLNKVEAIVSTADVQVDLSPLRNSIGSLQAASRALDYEKLTAERELMKIIHKIAKRKQKWRRLKWKAWKSYCKWQKKVFGKECKKHGGHGHHDEQFEHEDDPFAPWMADERREELSDDVKYGLAMAMALEGGEYAKSFLGGGCRERRAQLSEDVGAERHPHRPHIPGRLLRKLAKAAKRVRAVNQKLIAFERGFIHEDGIPQREWYRHLGVAPGKWLGYGATTLPALTESITIEKNATLAKYEVERLKNIVDGLAKTVRVEH